MQLWMCYIQNMDVHLNMNYVNADCPNLIPALCDNILDILLLFLLAQDELEITSRCLGQRGNYHSTGVLIRNRTTGEVVAQGRHSLFSLPVTASKL